MRGPAGGRGPTDRCTCAPTKGGGRRRAGAGFTRGERLGGGRAWRALTAVRTVQTAVGPSCLVGPEVQQQQAAGAICCLSVSMLNAAKAAAGPCRRSRAGGALGREQMVSHLPRCLWLLLLADQTAGHGRITRPASTRHGRSTAWFSNNVKIPGPPSLASPDLRTVQPNVTGQPEDVYVASPWRAPGSAPVLGSGCGVGGGDKLPYRNGGHCPGCPQGLDGKHLPKVGKPEEWKRGGTAEVAWMIAANHGGGYSWRLVSDAHRPHALHLFRAAILAIMAADRPALCFRLHAPSFSVPPMERSARRASKAIRWSSRGQPRTSCTPTAHGCQSRSPPPGPAPCPKGRSGRRTLSPAATCVMHTRAAAQRWILSAAWGLLPTRRIRASDLRQKPGARRRTIPRAASVSGSRSGQTTATAGRTRQ